MPGGLLQRLRQAAPPGPEQRDNHRPPAARARAEEALRESAVADLQATHGGSRRPAAGAPELYLHGLAEGDFDLALRASLGDGAPLSASSVARLKAGWQTEYELWKAQSVADLEVVYLCGQAVQEGKEAATPSAQLVGAGS
jgi:hypothetical protein